MLVSTVISICIVFIRLDCYAKLQTEELYKNLDEDGQQELFIQFIHDYQRNYSNEEYHHRFEIFKSNLLLADIMNGKEKEKGGSAIHGITKFFDYTVEESEKSLFGAKTLDLDKSAIEAKTTREYKTLPTSLTYVNWAGVYTTAVKNQGGCGSCWAFSVTEQVESDAIRLGWTVDYPMSTQQLVDCVTSNDGCGGGNVINAYEYLQSSGFELDTDYPYVATTQSCVYDSGKAYLKVVDYTFLNYDDPSQYTSTEINMANYVLNTGPLSVYVAGSAWLTYTSGILASCDTNLNHIVQIVGVDTENSYWIVRNSWGETWGESGYIRLQYMTNQCSLASYPSYVVAANF